MKDYSPSRQSMAMILHDGPIPRGLALPEKFPRSSSKDFFLMQDLAT